MKTVDVAMAVYGKPVQTAVTLATLFNNCEQYIDKVYFQEEGVQPYDDTVSQIPNCFDNRNIVHYRPKNYLGIEATDWSRLNEVDYRHSIRYQYAWENTDKDYLFIIHNDCLFTADIVGEMLKRLDNTRYVGVGLIGQCWNCPAKYAQVCSGDSYQYFRPTYEDACNLVSMHPSPRTTTDQIDKIFPMPFPECRLNEFACLINLKKVRHLVVPHGTIEPFGAFGTFGAFGADIGGGWFRKLTLSGFEFLNYFEGLKHAPFSSDGSGHSADSSKQLYDNIEYKAHLYLESSYPEIFQKLINAE